ncbi:MAG: hypothetical protein HYT90_00200 [Candidatus Omnitrophica bacterium]|nr:hypothetical protein [Candidatus Omnitrophota bacterium]
MSSQAPKPAEFGTFEFTFKPNRKLGLIGHRELLRIAEAAECRVTGWPIGVTMTRPEYSPKPVEDGIEALIDLRDQATSLRDTVDYWKLFRDGRLFFMRSYEEDTVWEGPARTQLHVDTRIRRVAEAFLYCSRLVNNLGLDSADEVSIRFSHDALKGRELGVADRNRLMHGGWKCHVDQVDKLLVVAVATIAPAISDLTYQVTSELFGMFDYFEMRQPTCSSIVEDLLRQKV